MSDIHDEMVAMIDAQVFATEYQWSEENGEPIHPLEVIKAIGMWDRMSEPEREAFRLACAMTTNWSIFYRQHAARRVES